MQSVHDYDEKMIWKYMTTGAKITGTTNRIEIYCIVLNCISDFTDFIANRVRYFWVASH